MHYQTAESNGSALPVQGKNGSESFASVPFKNLPLDAIAGPTYLTAQTLVQQVAYLLSDKLFTYSPDTFDLDAAVKEWSSSEASNVNGYTTGVQSLQTRHGAGSIALGYIFSPDFDLKKRHIPQGILGSSSSLHFLRRALEQLSLLYNVSNPFVAHIAAVDYVGGPSGGLVVDYSTALSLSEELGLGLVSSFSAHETQHMSLFATLLANVMPTVHIYDGVNVGPEVTRVIDVLDKSGLNNAYTSIAKVSANDKQEPQEVRLRNVLKAFNDELGTTYDLFEYHGHEEPESVLVVFGTAEASLAAQVARALERDGAKVGVINVRVYRPFDEAAFIQALPKSVRTVGVLGQVHNQQAVSDVSVSSSLYSDVLAALTFSSDFAELPRVTDIKYPRNQRWSPITIAASLQLLMKKPLIQANEEEQVPKESQPRLQLLDADSVQQYTFWDVDDSNSAEAAVTLGQALSKDSTNNVTIKTGHDNLLQGGVVKTEIRKSAKSIDAPYSIHAADVVYIGDERLLKSVDIVRSVRDGGKVVLKLPGVKDDDVEKKLSTGFRKSLAAKGLQLYIVDPSLSGLEADPALESSIVQVAFMRVALAKFESTGIEKLSSLGGNLEILRKVSQDLEKTLRQIEIPEAWASIEPEPDTVEIPADLQVNSFSAFQKGEVEVPSYLRDWQTAAKGLMFKEAYGTKSSLRPDLGVKTYTVRVKENRRLTPKTYDRNIFHIEFDLGDSGLKYDIGEALGIHAENDYDEVMQFIKFYHLDPDEVVEVPSREDPAVLENRTVYQSLMQNIDIFGRPPKRFYEALAEFASEDKEQKELLALGGPEGANEFKRRAEVDTVTYADILLEFPSAHPSFHDIVRIVNPMKRREYSIASCQAVTPTSVALMIVVVGWVDPQGRDRFGQATRYLNCLRVGAPVTVSVKPSVMKLPPKSTQPLIMAGLGTGLAPFRAFVQHRAMEKAQGKDIGAVLLYMGSRHQREEYCYGEEWEAYQAAGVVTLLGRAFSRDQPQKIYIQDRMRETLDEIIDAYIKEEGAFYLCGPTWPVPDVTNVLEEAIKVDGERETRKVDPTKEIEKLKDAGRYVLEVY